MVFLTIMKEMKIGIQIFLKQVKRQKKDVLDVLGMTFKNGEAIY